MMRRLNASGSAPRHAVRGLGCFTVLFALLLTTGSGEARSADPVPGKSWSGIVYGETVLGTSSPAETSCPALNCRYERHTMTVQLDNADAYQHAEIAQAGGPADGLEVGCGVEWERCYLQGYAWTSTYHVEYDKSGVDTPCVVTERGGGTGRMPAFTEGTSPKKLEGLLVRFQQPSPDTTLLSLLEFGGLLNPNRTITRNLSGCTETTSDTALALPVLQIESTAPSLDPPSLAGDKTTAQGGSYKRYRWSLTRYPDRDHDGAPDHTDNCPDVVNPWQEDADGDGRGDACEADTDNDGVPDTEDNCPAVANPGQEPSARGGPAGAACTDSDGDGQMDAVDPCPLDAENACDEVPPPGDPEERCRPFDVSWRAAFGAGSDQMEYGVSGSWCTDGTSLRVVGTPQTYGEILTPPLLAALGSVFDLHFRYTNEHPVVGIETMGDSITLTADGTFELCGSVIPFGSALAKIPALKGLAKALDHAPAAVRRKITPLVAAAITRWFAITGRAFGLTEPEAVKIEIAIGMILDEALQKVGSIFSPTCLPAWQPEITVNLSASGTAAAFINGFGSLLTMRQSSSVGIP